MQLYQWAIRATETSWSLLLIHELPVYLFSFAVTIGLRYDDVLREETDIIREAVNRLPDNEGYERVYRMKCAFQYSLSHTIATKEGTLKPEDDIRYLTPIIDEVAAEFAEKDDFNNIKSFTK